MIIDLTSADPVSTRKVSATNQIQAVMVGGKVFDKYRPILNTIGQLEKVIYVGPNGAGDTIKCVNNFLSACCVAATTEALMVW